MLYVKHGLGIFTNGKVQKLLYLFVPGQLRNRDHLPVRCEELHHLQAAFGDRTCLVAEQDVERSCSLDSFRLSHKDVVVQHLTGILHQHQRDHKRQTLRNRTDDDHDGKGNRFHDILDDLLHAHGEIRRKSPCRHDKIGKIQDCNDRRAHIAEHGDLTCQFGQLHFQRRIDIILLHLIRHPAHHGLKSDLPYVQNAFPVKDNRSAEQRMPIHEGIAGDLIRQFKAFLCSRLLTLLRLAV